MALLLNQSANADTCMHNGASANSLTLLDTDGIYLVNGRFPTPNNSTRVVRKHCGIPKCGVDVRWMSSSSRNGVYCSAVTCVGYICLCSDVCRRRERGRYVLSALCDACDKIPHPAGRSPELLFFSTSRRVFNAERRARLIPRLDVCIEIIRSCSLYPHLVRRTQAQSCLVCCTG